MIRPTALLLSLSAACGPVMATSVVGDAEVALARAHAAEGEKYALYETTLADLYLVKAREEQGRARYAEARDLAAEALKYAEAATRKAAERRTAAEAPPTPTATVQHPAEPGQPVVKPLEKQPPPVPPEKAPEPARRSVKPPGNRP